MTRWNRHRLGSRVRGSDGWKDGNGAFPGRADPELTAARVLAACGLRALRASIVALLVAFSAAPSAQTPDSTAAAPILVDSTAARPPAARRDSIVALASPTAPPLGRAATPVFAVTGDLDPQALLADRAEAFGYALGAPGRWGRRLAVEPRPRRRVAHARRARCV